MPGSSHPTQRKGNRLVGGPLSAPPPQSCPNGTHCVLHCCSQPLPPGARGRGAGRMTICEDVSLIARSLGLASALTASVRDSKSSGYPSMCLRKPSDNLDVMVLPSTLESLAACSADVETCSPRRTPERKVSMPSRVADALVSRSTSSAAKELALVLHADRVERDASAIVLQERVRFQLVQRYRARHSPAVRARKVPRRRPVALFASVFERFGIGLFTPPPAPCAIDVAIDRITGTDHRPIPPLYSPYRSFYPHCFPKSRYEHGRVLVHTQFERSLDRQAAGELCLSSSE